MRIRTKILVYFSSSVIVLSALSMGVVYYLFAEHREEAFQQQQHAKIKQTIELLNEFKHMNAELSQTIDKQNIHDFYDEKLLVFDRHKQLIFSSLDDLSITRTNEILHQLSPSNTWIETKDGDYDLIGVYIESKKQSYYAISKAYDAFGYSKKNFLKKTLIVIFGIITCVVILLSLYLANLIAQPIAELSERIDLYDLNKENKPIQLYTSTKEIKVLEQRFNELLKRTHEAFTYQKHIVHHISHELKTPLAILVSELEKIKDNNNLSTVQQLVEHQVIRAKSLGSIVHTLLEIAKLEATSPTNNQVVRIDELLFDIIDDLKLIYPNFQFELNYSTTHFDEQLLAVQANKSLIIQAFQNILLNCITYSDRPTAKITIDCTSENGLQVCVINSGPIIDKKEEKQLFTRFFRGKNSLKKPGLGMGLALTKKIIDLHQGTIQYRSQPNRNTFIIHFQRTKKQIAP